MVDLTLLQSVSYIAGAIGVCIGALGFAFNIRTNQKNIMQTLDTRKAQLYMSLISQWNTKEFSKMRYESYNMEFTNFDDFSKKYGPNNNLDIYASWNIFGRSIVALADLWRNRLIDLNFIDGIMITDILNWWANFGSMEKERWERGRPGWLGSVPFIMAVIDYWKIKNPFYFDENGNYRSMTRSSNKPWVKPEEMRPLMEKLKIK